MQAAQQLVSARCGVSRRPNFCGWFGAPTASASDPPDVYAEVEPRAPVILVFPGTASISRRRSSRPRPDQRAKVLISLHRDGEFNALAAERLGIETIRGSGDHGSAFNRKGGVGAFMEMVARASGRL